MSSNCTVVAPFLSLFGFQCRFLKAFVDFRPSLRRLLSVGSNRMPFLSVHTFLLLLLPSFPAFLSQFAAPSSDHCHHFPDDPMCATFFSSQQHQSAPATAAQNSANLCQHQDLWLIPGKPDSSCTRPNPKRFAEVNARQIKILPPAIKLPGCFTVEIQNVHILEGASNNIFAKTEYQWINAVGSKNGAKCQNASADGCGGFGNECYYCDICKSLRSIDEHSENKDIPPAVAEQFKRMSCPDKSGFYSFRKEFCLDDWSIIDSDNDCRLDFLEPVSPSENDQMDVQSALSALQQIGYGTLVAKVRLAYNATPIIEAKKAQKEAQIERTVLRELERERTTTEWNSDFANFSRWVVEQRTAKWHKSEYLPWLLHENEIACIRLTFDVCQRQPQRKWEGSDGREYTCI